MEETRVIGTCKCGTQFEFTENDIIYKRKNIFDNRVYIICPCCCRKLAISDNDMKKYFNLIRVKN